MTANILQLLQSATPGAPGPNVLPPAPEPQPVIPSAADLPEAGIPSPGAVGIDQPPAVGIDGGVQNARRSAKVDILSSGTRDLNNYLGEIDATQKKIERNLGSVAKQRASATGDITTAVQGVADIQSEVARRATELKQTSVQRDMEWRKDILAKQEQAQQRAEQQFGEMMANMREVARKEVDPNRFWHSRDTGQKVAITIGMILHDIGAGLSGSNRRGIDILNTLIERDIDAQRQDITTAQKGVEVEQFEYTNQQKFDADNLAREDTRRIMALENVAQQIDMFAMMTQDEVIQKQAKIAIGELEQKQAEVTERTVSTLADANMRTLGIKGSALESRLRMQLSAAAGGAPESWPTGMITQYKDLQASKIRLTEMERLFGETDWSAFVTQFVPGTDERNYKLMRGQIVGEMTKALFGGHASERDRDMIDGLIPKAWTTGWSAASMFAQLNKRVAEKEAGFLEAARVGGRPPTNQPYEDFGTDIGEGGEEF